MATNNARDNLQKREYFARYGIPEGLRHLAEEFPFRLAQLAGAVTPNLQGAAV